MIVRSQSRDAWDASSASTWAARFARNVKPFAAASSMSPGG